MVLESGSQSRESWLKAYSTTLLRAYQSFGVVFGRLEHFTCLCGIFALYSLLCRDSQMGLLNSSGAAEGNLSAYNSENSVKEKNKLISKTALQESLQFSHFTTPSCTLGY
ncbi:hypothetical protein IFM89_002628 [Coptis chinensis]|uniref:Uncharacterized protein n=1 Tax=Coptis chinensis TaxID=261450 RepID=A0A835GWI8_9MAGN|nr:hypothetical protein IFM89_002628 [Coptis chinensis]